MGRAEAGQSGRDVRSHSRAAASGGAGAWGATAVRGGRQDLPGHPRLRTRLRPRPAAVLPCQADAAGGERASEAQPPVAQPAAPGGRCTRNLFDPLHGCHPVLCCRLAELTAVHCHVSNTAPVQPQTNGFAERSLRQIVFPAALSSVYFSSICICEDQSLRWTLRRKINLPSAIQSLSRERPGVN